MAGEQIMAVVGALMALAIAVYSLRDARWWQREEKHLPKPRAKRERTGGEGPWGG